MSRLLQSVNSLNRTKDWPSLSKKEFCQQMAFGLWPLALSHSISFFWVFGLIAYPADLGLTNFHNYMIQLLKINLSLGVYSSSWFCFFGEPWLLEIWEKVPASNKRWAPSWRNFYIAGVPETMGRRWSRIQNPDSEYLFLETTLLTTAYSYSCLWRNNTL